MRVEPLVHLPLPLALLAPVATLCVWLAPVWLFVGSYLRLLDPRVGLVWVIVAVGFLVAIDGGNRRVQAPAVVERRDPSSSPRSRADSGFWNLPNGQWRDEPAPRAPRQPGPRVRAVIASWGLPEEPTDALPF